MWDKHGGEFFVILPLSGSTMKNKMERMKALEAIADAIEGGEQPGAVNVS